MFLKPCGPKNFKNGRSHRCDSIRQIFVQIGAILAIFRPFEVSGSNFFLTLNGRFLLEDGSDYEHIIDRIERIIESIKSNLTKNPKIFDFVFQRFFDLQAPYRTETLTPDRSRAPRRGKKIKNLQIDRIGRLDRPTARSMDPRSGYLIRTVI